jgi:hypothetical protein
MSAKVPWVSVVEVTLPAAADRCAGGARYYCRVATMELREYRDRDSVPTREVFERAVRLTASQDYSDEQIEAWAPAKVDDRDLAEWALARANAQTIVAVEHGEVLGFSDLVVVPRHVVHPDLLGGWRCRSPSNKEEPDEAPR